MPFMLADGISADAIRINRRAVKWNKHERRESTRVARHVLRFLLFPVEDWKKQKYVRG